MPSARHRWGAAIASVALCPSVVSAQTAAPGVPSVSLPPIVVTAPAAKRARPPAAQKSGTPPPQAAAEPVPSLGISPVTGAELAATKIPGLAVVLLPDDLERDKSPVPSNVLQQRIPGIVVNDVLG